MSTAAIRVGAARAEIARDGTDKAYCSECIARELN